MLIVFIHVANIIMSKLHIVSSDWSCGFIITRFAAVLLIDALVVIIFCLLLSFFGESCENLTSIAHSMKKMRFFWFLTVKVISLFNLQFFII